MWYGEDQPNIHLKEVKSEDVRILQAEHVEI